MSLSINQLKMSFNTISAENYALKAQLAEAKALAESRLVDLSDARDGWDASFDIATKAEEALKEANERAEYWIKHDDDKTLLIADAVMQTQLVMGAHKKTITALDEANERAERARGWMIEAQDRAEKTAAREKALVEAFESLAEHFDGHDHDDQDCPEDDACRCENIREITAAFAVLYEVTK